MKLSARKAVSTLILAVLVLLSAAAPSPSEDPQKKDDTTALANTGGGGGYGWSFYSVATLSTAILTVSAGIGVLISLFLPLFAYKICYLIGACPDPLEFYVAQFLTDEDDLSRKTPINRRSPRSANYVNSVVAPLLATFADAYGKYYEENSNNNDGLSKNFQSSLRF